MQELPRCRNVIRGSCGRVLHRPAHVTATTTILVLLAAVALTAALARRAPLPLPLVLIAAGVALSFVPGLDRVEIEPHVFFLLFIPPLLFADGWLMPKRELFAVLRPVLLLAFGLVLMTTLGIGWLIHLMIPSIPLMAAFALGAIVSPTDATATSAMVSRVGLPPRVTHILNGESLINDASGLVAFRLALVALATGTFSWWQAAGTLAVVAAGGAAIGIAIAAMVHGVRVRLRRYGGDDPHAQTVLSVLTPFAAYLAAESVHASGILAVVAAGLYAGWNDFRHADAATRQHAWEVWAMLLFAFNGLAFLLLGLTLSHALTALEPGAWPRYVAYALALWAALTVLRLVWVFPSAYLPQVFARRAAARGRLADPRQVFLVGWAGLRGAVTMAAALSIPATLATGEAFPERHLILFLAGSTIVLTLVLNGLPLPLIARALGVAGDHAGEHDRRVAELAIVEAATAALQRELVTLSRPEDLAQARELIAHYARRADRLTADAARSSALVQKQDLERRLMLLALDAERRQLYALRDAGTINDETLREIETRLDGVEMAALGATRTAHRA
jgi:Na+/H+ antiporter